MTKPSIDLNTMSAEELIQLIKEAETALSSKKEGAKANLIAEMKEKATALGLDLGDLLDKPSPRTNVRRPRNDAGQKIAAKFRGPNGEEWTGRGRKPTWLTTLEAEGKTKEEYAV